MKPKFTAKTDHKMKTRLYGGPHDGQIVSVHEDAPYIRMAVHKKFDANILKTDYDPGDLTATVETVKYIKRCFYVPPHDTKHDVFVFEDLSDQEAWVFYLNPEIGDAVIEELRSMPPVAPEPRWMRETRRYYVRPSENPETWVDVRTREAIRRAKLRMKRGGG